MNSVTLVFLNLAGYLAALTDFLSRPACLLFTALIRLLCPDWLAVSNLKLTYDEDPV